MKTMERDGEAFVVPAALLAEVFDISEEHVRREMRDGGLTSRIEWGQEEDEGRWRLTFHRGGRACRFIVDNIGTILTQAKFPIRTGVKGDGGNRESS